MNKKSNEIPQIDELPDIDYSDIPSEIEEVVGQQPYVIEKKVKLTWDGDQFIARIPSEITEELGLTSNSQVKMKFGYSKPLPKENREPDLKDVDIELVE